MGFTSASSLCAQEYVEICDCERGIRGVCKEYLDSNWQITNAKNATWYYYNYSFGRHRFFNWSWSKSFVRKHDLLLTDSLPRENVHPHPLTGHFRWKRKHSDEIVVEQEFDKGWPSGQTRAFSRKGYLIESLDFSSPYNYGKFSMICHWYHRGKLEVQCVIAVDMNENKEYAVEIPLQAYDVPTTVGFIPQFRRSLVMDIQGLRSEYITAENTPVLFHLISESSYSPSAEPLRLGNGDPADTVSISFLDIYNDGNTRQRKLILLSENEDVMKRQPLPYSDVRAEPSEYQMLKTVKNELKQSNLRHVLISIDTLQHCISSFGENSPQFLDALKYVDRSVSELMLIMRLNSRELDWNCVLITSSESNTGVVPWILWGEGVRPNHIIENKVNACEARSTFSRFAHISDGKNNCLIRSCFFSEYKRRNR